MTLWVVSRLFEGLYKVWGDMGTFVEYLRGDADNLEIGVGGHADFLVLVVGGWHPEGEAAVVYEGLGGELEDVVEHGEEAVGLFGGDKILFSFGGVG